MPNIEKKTTGSSSDGCLSGCLILLLIFGGCSVFLTIDSQRAAEKAEREAAERSLKRAGKKAAEKAEIERIQTMPISEITLEEIYKIYSYESKYTALQKDEIWKNYQGKKVKWTAIVSSVSESSGRLYMWV